MLHRYIETFNGWPTEIKIAATICTVLSVLVVVWGAYIVWKGERENA